MEAEDKRPGYSQYLVILFELCMEKTRTHLSNSWESSWRVREIHKAADILRFLQKTRAIAGDNGRLSSKGCHPLFREEHFQNISFSLSESLTGFLSK